MLGRQAGGWEGIATTRDRRGWAWSRGPWGERESLPAAEVGDGLTGNLLPLNDPDTHAQLGRGGFFRYRSAVILVFVR